MNNAGCMQSWDADLAALRDAVDGDYVFMFGNNDTGDFGDLDGQDLLAWARVTVHDKEGILEDKIFTLSGNNTLLAQQSQAQTSGTGNPLLDDDILPTADDLWAYVHSEICMSQSTGQVWLGDCSTVPPALFTDGKTINQSLGQDEAGFAVTNKELSDLINNTATNGYDYLTADVRFSHINNGGDLIWVMGTEPTEVQVPTPATVAMLGLGLVMLAGFRRRRGKMI
jgi:hypothetical protein